MASLSSMFLRGLGQGASKHSLRAASTPLLASLAARRSHSLFQTRGIYADATGKTYERQGLVMYVAFDDWEFRGLRERVGLGCASMMTERHDPPGCRL